MMTPGKLYHVTAPNPKGHPFEFAALLMGMGRDGDYAFHVLTADPDRDNPLFPGQNGLWLVGTGAFDPKRTEPGRTWTSREIHVDELPTFLHWRHKIPDFDRVLAGTDPNDLPAVREWRFIHHKPISTPTGE